PLPYPFSSPLFPRDLFLLRSGQEDRRAVLLSFFSVRLFSLAISQSLPSLLSPPPLSLQGGQEAQHGRPQLHERITETVATRPPAEPFPDGGGHTAGGGGGGGGSKRHHDGDGERKRRIQALSIQRMKRQLFWTRPRGERVVRGGKEEPRRGWAQGGMTERG
ncbi:unnamed protein product, partial [Closterium sp. Naga37s-1]